MLTGQALQVGLTGGIGSGKSTVAARWVALGAALIDTDALAHGLTAPGGAAMPILSEAFGADVVDDQGALDRARMRQLVFHDPAARRRLEAILHPMIGQQALAQADAARHKGHRLLLFDVPLLNASSPFRARCDRILVLDCSATTQVSRVMARSGWTQKQVQSVMAQQLGREARRAIADAVILNDGLSLADLQAEVDALWAAWCP